MIIEAWGGPHDGKLIQLAEGIGSLGVVHIPMGPPALYGKTDLFGPDDELLGVLDPAGLLEEVMNDPLTQAIEHGVYECWLEPHPLGVDRLVVKNPEFWW